MRRATFAQAAAGEGASALNRVFEQYLVPITFSAEQLHLHMSYNDVDAAASPLWYDDDGKVLAAALLAIRGKRAWIGGFGIAPQHRGRRYAGELLRSLEQAARERGAKSIQLEVLVDNHRAIHTYRRGGFEIRRTLHSFERIVQDARKPEGFSSRSPDEFIDMPDAVRPCWQRERAALRNGAVSTAVADSNANYALFRFNAHAAQLFKVGAAGTESLDTLAYAIASGREFQNVLLLNEPDESPIASYAKTARWSEPFTQYEMKLQL